MNNENPRGETITMAITRDLKTLFHLLFAPIRGQSHQERLDSFYHGQAEDYDRFRKHLLHGREDLYRNLVVPRNGIWIEMGGGTAANLEHLGPLLHDLHEVHIVDLSASLLEIAQDRIRENAWDNVQTHLQDAAAFTLPSQADVVTFSYSLTMIPDWFLALENAYRLLKPGGLLGVVDFYVGRKFPPGGMRKHSWFTRTFWPAWFGNDNVHPNADHVPYLHHHFEPVAFEERRGSIKYLPFLKVPYYWFVGRKR